MKNAKQLTNDVLDYLYEVRHYDMCDTYNSREEAFEDLFKIMSSGEGVLTEMMKELNTFIKYEDLSNHILKRQCDDCYKICCDLNLFFSEKEKEMDIS